MCNVEKSLGLVVGIENFVCVCVKWMSGVRLHVRTVVLQVTKEPREEESSKWKKRWV